ncbi:MAG: PDZ domain-containing protein [Rhodospirillales bacterium]
MRGAVISEVQPGSVAEQAGLQAGDVIVGVGEQAITSPGEATHAIRDALKNSQAVALRIIRDGQPAFVAVTPSQNDQANNDNDDDSK